MCEKQTTQQQVPHERVVMPTSPEEFERELFKLINDHVKRGLKKPDLVAKMKWATGNCDFA